MIEMLRLEEEFVQNQALLKPSLDKNEQERKGVDDLRGSPMSVGSLEEIIDDYRKVVPFNESDRILHDDMIKTVGFLSKVQMVQ